MAPLVANARPLPRAAASDSGVQRTPAASEGVRCAARHQVQKFSMRPNQRHSTSSRHAGIEPSVGQRRSITYLFRNEATRSDDPRHHLRVRQGIEAQKDIEIAALACEQ
jgi:hypothetical protein